jgi:hypothetical protein
MTINSDTDVRALQAGWHIDDLAYTNRTARSRSGAAQGPATF